MTVAVEVPLAIVIVRGHARVSVAAAALAANLLSRPLLTFGLLRWLPGPFLVRVGVGEGVVIALDAVIYRATLRNLTAGRALNDNSAVIGNNARLAAAIAGALAQRERSAKD